LLNLQNFKADATGLEPGVADLEITGFIQNGPHHVPPRNHAAPPWTANTVCSDGGFQRSPNFLTIFRDTRSGNFAGWFIPRYGGVYFRNARLLRRNDRKGKRRRWSPVLTRAFWSHIKTTSNPTVV